MNSPMKQILVVGANGFTGRKIFTDLSSCSIYQVTGCSLHPAIAPVQGAAFVAADIRDAAAVAKLFEAVRPDVVINTSALSVPDYCETHHEEAYETNVMAVGHLAEQCEKMGAKLIHLSTDFVFDGGEERLYTEDDLPLPVNYYGVTKLQGEQVVASRCCDWAVARVCVVYGKSLPGQHGNILQLVYNRLTKGETIQVVKDQYRTPTYVGDISKGVQALIHHAGNGIFHLCGKDCLSVSELAFRVADRLHLDRSLILPVSTAEMNEATPRPMHSGMSIAKTSRLIGYQPVSLDEGIDLMFMNH